MTEQIPVYQILVNDKVVVGKLKEDRVRGALLAFGVQSEETFEALLTGRTLRVLGKNIRLMSDAIPERTEQVRRSPFDDEIGELSQRGQRFRKHSFKYAAFAIGMVVLGIIFLS